MNHKPKKITVNQQLISAAGFTAALTICFFTLEFVRLPSHFRAFFTFLLSGGSLYLLYLSVQKHRFLKRELIFAGCLIIVVNHLYDPVTFETYFPFPFPWAAAGAGVLCLLGILFPALKAFVSRFRQRSGEKGEKAKKSRDAQGQNVSLQEQSCASALPQKTLRKKMVWTGKREAKENRLSIAEILLALSILGMSLWFSTVFIRRLMAYQNSDIQRLIGNMNSLVPLILIGILSTVIIFIILCTYSKLIKVMIDILRGDDSPAIYVIGIMVISVFLSESGYFNQDRMLDLLSRGDIFSLPIAALIIYPVFVLSTHTINQLLRDHNVYRKMLGRTTTLTKRVLTIGYNILNSSITLAEAVTCDFLGNLIEIINEEDEEENEYE